MVTQWVEDPSWGRILGNLGTQFSDATGEALRDKLLAEQVKSARQERAQKQQQWDAGVKASGGLDAAVPEASVPPTDYRAPGPMIGDPTNPADTAGIPTVDLQYTDPRAQALAEARRNLLVNSGKATILHDPSAAPAQLGYASVGAAGIPKTADERAQLQVMLTGKLPTETERAASPAHNLAVYGPDGQPTGQIIATQDFKRDLQGRPIALPPGHTVVATGPAATEPTNPLKDDGTRMKLITEAATKVANGYDMPADEAMKVGAALATQYGLKSKLQSDAVGNTMVVKNFQENEVPGIFNHLAGHINRKLFAPPPPQPGTPPQSDTVPAPGQSGQLFPPMQTNIISQAPSSHEQTVAARAASQAQTARRTLISLMGGDPQTGQLPPNPYVPGALAAYINEKNGGSMLGGGIIKNMDQNALDYFAAAKTWVEPVLRIASGAAIRDAEYADYYQMFIPNANDSPQGKLLKLERMKAWEEATAQASTANGALDILERISKGQPALAPPELVEKMRVKVNQAGTGDVPKEQLLQQPRQPTSTNPTVLQILRGQN